MKTLNCNAVGDQWRVKANTLQIDGCACAIIDCTDGQLIYDYDLLVQHFHAHEGMGEHDEEGEEGLTATEWVDYNVVRGVPYHASPDVIAPDIVVEGKSVFADDEDED